MTTTPGMEPGDRGLVISVVVVIGLATAATLLIAFTHGDSDKCPDGSHGGFSCSTGTDFEKVDPPPVKLERLESGRRFSSGEWPLDARRVLAWYRRHNPSGEGHVVKVVVRRDEETRWMVTSGVRLYKAVAAAGAHDGRPVVVKIVSPAGSHRVVIAWVGNESFGYEAPDVDSGLFLKGATVLR